MGSEQVIILVVEDELLIRLAALDMIEDAGYTALEASNADEAIALLEAHPDIRILFTDIEMPGSLDGMKLAAYVRDRWPPIEIIVTSAALREEHILPSRGIFLAKPYEPGALAGHLAGFAR